MEGNAAPELDALPSAEAVSAKDCVAAELWLSAADAEGTLEADVDVLTAADAVCDTPPEALAESLPLTAAVGEGPTLPLPALVADTLRDSTGEMESDAESELVGVVAAERVGSLLTVEVKLHELETLSAVVAVEVPQLDGELLALTEAQTEAARDGDAAVDEEAKDDALDKGEAELQAEGEFEAEGEREAPLELLAAALAVGDDELLGMTLLEGVPAEEAVAAADAETLLVEERDTGAESVAAALREADGEEDASSDTLGEPLGDWEPRDEADADTLLELISDWLGAPDAETH